MTILVEDDTIVIDDSLPEWPMMNFRPYDDITVSLVRFQESLIPDDALLKEPPERAVFRVTIEL